ncbi:hypothetical protein OFM97_27560, partial [Escherichia coli]|nr:hypothetical protein [Escherichia coli]
TAAEYLQNYAIAYSQYPGPEFASALDPQSYATPVAYLNGQISLWFPDSDLQLPDDLESDDGREKRIALGSLLRRHSVMHVLLHDLQGGILSER